MLEQGWRNRVTGELRGVLDLTRREALIGVAVYDYVSPDGSYRHRVVPEPFRYGLDGSGPYDLPLWEPVFVGKEQP